jgi:hypothetical protein
VKGVVGKLAGQGRAGLIIAGHVCNIQIGATMETCAQ